MKFPFDQVIDRNNTNSVKYDAAAEAGKRKDILPMWVADMDFAAPKEVTDALKRQAEFGIFGYTSPSESYLQAVSSWFSRNFRWNNNPEWIVPIPGVVYAVNCAIHAYTQKADSVLILQPVYHPFARTILKTDRNLVISNLLETDGYYEVDYEDFERKIIENHVRLFILCSPHNPVGRVWKKEELIRMGEICLKHHVLIISDEIHADFVYPGFQHTVFASLRKDFAENCIICTAPTKTFNLASLKVSNTFIPNPELRKTFEKALAESGGGSMNIMGLTAGEAAYTYGQAWKDELVSYLQGNIDYLYNELSRLNLGIHFRKPEGSYLIWLDCRDMKLSEKELHAFWDDKANIWLNEGTMFGAAGEGFMRMNIACPRKIIEEAIKRLQSVHTI